MSAAPLGTGERHQTLGPTAPACLALAMGTVRRVNQRRVRRASKTGSTKRGVLLSGLDDGINPMSFAIPGMCNCRDNTAGSHCEKCTDGYYGDATAGTASDCQPCPCPGGSSCAVVPRTKEVVCTSCQAGTTGVFLHKKSFFFLFFFFPLFFFLHPMRL